MSKPIFNIRANRDRQARREHVRSAGHVHCHALNRATPFNLPPIGGELGLPRVTYGAILTVHQDKADALLDALRLADPILHAEVMGMAGATDNADESDACLAGASLVWGCLARQAQADALSKAAAGEAPHA